MAALSLHAPTLTKIAKSAGTLPGVSNSRCHVLLCCGDPRIPPAHPKNRRASAAHKNLGDQIPFPRDAPPSRLTPQ
jgi:hypothetical protein